MSEANASTTASADTSPPDDTQASTDTPALTDSSSNSVSSAQPPLEPADDSAQTTGTSSSPSAPNVSSSVEILPDDRTPPNNNERATNISNSALSISDVIATPISGSDVTVPSSTNPSIPPNPLLPNSNIDSIAQATDLPINSENLASNTFSVYNTISASAKSTKEAASTDNNSMMIVGVILGIVVLIFLVGGGFIWNKRRNKKSKMMEQYGNPYALDVENNNKGGNNSYNY